MSIKIPIPTFVSCDETSLKVRVVEPKDNAAGPSDSFPPPGYKLKLECRTPEEDWKDARTVEVDDENTFSGEDIADLEPGNPYFIRFLLIAADGTKQYGPETVFDTKPVDCTPKEKKCVIC